ncbi:MAG: fibronectin type III domain-containing protein [Bacteroidales bacterium]|nr:fibronectin type III domain-containing protein [Bacteroidales bacterium]
MKKILSIITVCILAFFACKKDIELLHETVPEIVTEECTDITESSAVLTCKLTNQGSASVEYGFYYSEAPNNTPTTVDKTISLSTQSNKSFRYTLTGLKENTTYYVRAYARNRVGEAQGKIVQFTTLSKKLPTMGSTSVTNVTTNSATLSGNIASAGTGTVKERGFCLSTTKTPTIADSCIFVGLGIGSFNYTLTELEDGITFYVRAYATSEVGTAYGETMSFTTASEQLPIVVTKSVTEITPWYATLNGELESEGTSSVTEMGFCYSATTQTPTLLDEYVKVNGSSFASVITTLSEGTTYYVRAYATNGKGTAYGDVVSFKTESLSKVSMVFLDKIDVNSAQVSFNLTSQGSSPVTEMGFYYGSTPFTMPTYGSAEHKYSIGHSTDCLVFNMTGLAEGTSYYVCAYATNSSGTVYGVTRSFTTKTSSLPSVSTVSVSNVSYSSAIVNGLVTSDVGINIAERGVCWNTTGNPTVSNSKKVSGSGIGSFSVSISGLNEGTTYYARAYATNGTKTAYVYGNVISFTTGRNETSSVEVVDGAIQAAFSVSDTKKVYFSQGNLQYQASSGTWRFAENQYDMIGNDNSNISSTYSGWIDLFGWGTSGYNGKSPYMTSTEEGDYGNGENDIAGTNYDWGVYNKISNGGNQTGLWRTLTSDEWSYLLNNAVIARAKVNGVNGMVLLPDNITLPSTVTFVSGMWAENKYTVEQWSALESAGAVFLPASGIRYGSYVTSFSHGYCWSSSLNGYADTPEYMFFTDGQAGSYYNERGYGCSVRLVRDID